MGTPPDRPAATNDRGPVATNELVYNNGDDSPFDHIATSEALDGVDNEGLGRSPRSATGAAGPGSGTASALSGKSGSFLPFPLCGPLVLGVQKQV